MLTGFRLSTPCRSFRSRVLCSRASVSVATCKSQVTSAIGTREQADRHTDCQTDIPFSLSLSLSLCVCVCVCVRASAEAAAQQHCVAQTQGSQQALIVAVVWLYCSSLGLRTCVLLHTYSRRGTLLPHAVRCVRFFRRLCLRLFRACMKYLGNR